MSHPYCSHIEYSLNCAEFDDLLAIARGLCMLCKKPVERLQIDHDHKLGRWAVRGVVCHGCNQRLKWVDSGAKEATVSIAQYLADAWHLSQPSSAVKKARVKPRVDCPVCGLNWAVSASGGPRAHWSRWPAPAGVCPGSPPGSKPPPGWPGIRDLEWPSPVVAAEDEQPEHSGTDRSWDSAAEIASRVTRLAEEGKQ